VFWQSPNHQTNPEKARMNIHSLARTTPASRALIASRRDAGLDETFVADQFGIDRKTVRKWTKRRRDEGDAGLKDRTSRPKRSPMRTPDDWRWAIESLRRLRFTQERITKALGLKKSTVQRVCVALGLSKLSDLEPPVPENRYVRSRPGELVHVDTKKLGRFYRPGHRVTGDRTAQSRARGIGWEFLHIAIDDATRLAYAEILRDELGTTCAAFLRRAALFFKRHGINHIERVMSDNGSGYISGDFAKALRELEARHQRTKPYTPRTNGKAERLIQTLLRLWAYARSYENSDERAATLEPWIRWYNRQRPHGSLEGRTPMQTLRMLNRDNLLGDHN
jgi:transposase InsO family protein